MPIYSDDPMAVEKLQNKLRQLQDNQQRMKKINAAWRKAGKPAANNLEGWAAIERTLGCEAEALQDTRLMMARDFLDRAPFTYHITNNNGNMKRIKDRIAGLIRVMEAESKEAFDKLTPQGQAAAKGLVNAFFEGEEKVERSEY